MRPLLATALATAERDGTMIEHTIGALSFADAETLLGSAVPGPVRGAIYEAGGGNPFYLQQLAREHAAGRSVTAEPSGAASPRPSLGRSSRRSPAQRGRPPARPGRRGRGRPGRPRPRDRRRRARRGRALHALDELLAGGLLTTTDIPRRYRFRHPLVRLAIYESAADGWRIAAHGRAAEALPARGGSLAARAHHLERCARPGDTEAVDVLVEAGRHAAARAPATAADRFAAALRLLPETPETLRSRLELLVGLAQALAATGRLERALEALGKGLALVGPELAPVRARLVAGCAMCENLLGRHAAAHARLLGALAEIGELVRDRRPRGRARRRRPVRQRLPERARVGAARARDRRAIEAPGFAAVAPRWSASARSGWARSRTPSGCARTPRRGSTRSTTARSPAASTPPTTSGSPSSSASATTTRSATSAAASRSRARPARASS